MIDPITAGFKFGSETVKLTSKIGEWIPKIYKWSEQRHKDRQERKHDIIRALAAHTIFKNVVLPENLPKDPWLTIRNQHGDACGNKNLRKWFGRTSGYAPIGDKAAIVLLFLWIIAQSHHGAHGNTIRSLVARTVQSGLNEIGKSDDDVQQVKNLVKSLAKAIAKCPLEAGLCKDLNVLLPPDRFNSELVESLRRSNGGHIHFKTTNSPAPALLLERQSQIILPLDVDAARLVMWAKEKLGLGHLVTEENDLDKNKFWNAFDPRSEH